MTHLREDPNDISDPGEEERKLRAGRMLHAIDIGIDTARLMADSALNATSAADRENILFQIIWALDRVSEATSALDRFIDAFWPEPGKVAETATS
jgi:hypothetical protein